MAISLDSIRTTSGNNPPRIVVYGVQGVGKTTLAYTAPDPVFIQTEKGEGKLKLKTFGILKTYDEVYEALCTLAQDDHDFKTVVIDTADWLEPLVWAKAVEVHNASESSPQKHWKDIETAGYGKGYLAAADQWQVLLNVLDYLNDKKGMNVIWLAHNQVKKFDDPESESYDRYSIKLHARASAKLQENVDAVLFMSYSSSTTEDSASFGGSGRVRAVGSGQRMIRTQERPAVLAKNRYGMPAQIPIEGKHPWSEIAPYFTNEQQQTMETENV